MSETGRQGEGRLLAARQLDLVYQRYPFFLSSSMLVSGALVVALWPLVESPTLLVWLFSLWLVIGVRYFYSRRYIEFGGGDLISVEQWQTGLVLGAAAAGICWGAAILFAPAESFGPATTLLMFVLAGVSAFACVLLAAAPMAATVFLLPALLPVSMWLFSFGERLHYFMGAITLFYLALLLMFARYLHRMFLTTLSTDEQNKGLDALLQQVKTLERESALFRRIVDDTLSPAIFVNKFGNSKFDYVNKAACHHFGASREKILSWDVPDYDPNYDADKVAALNEVLKHEGHFRFESEHLLASGERIPVEVILNAVEFDGEWFVVGYFHSLVKQKAEEARVRQLERTVMRQESEQRMQRYFETAPGYFYTLVQRSDGSYAMPFASPGIRDLFGLEPEDVAQDIAPFAALAHPDDKVMTFLKTEESARALTPYQVEYRIVHPQKGLRWIAVHSLPQRTPDGGVRWDGYMHDITERKAMEETLVARERESRRQAQFQQSLLSGLRDAGIMLVVVENGCFVYTNDYYVGCQLGYAEGQLPGTVSFMELIHPDDRPRIAEMHRDRLAGKPVPSSYEIGALGGDGSRREYEFHVTLVPDTEPPQTLLLTLRIDERKRAEMELQRREREFRTLAENSPDPIYRYDRDGRRLYANTMACKLSGKPETELIGKLFSDDSILIPEQRPQLLEAVQRVFDCGESVRIDLGFVIGTDYRDYQMRLVPERDAFEQVVSVLAIARDITELKDAQRRAEQFVANFPGFVYSYRMTPDGRDSFPFASPGIEKLYGLKPADVKDSSAALHALAHPDDAPGIIDALVESARTMSPIHMEYRICRPGLPERWTEFRSCPVREADGSIVWHGIMVDIDERKRAGEQLVSSQKMLADAQKLARLGSWDWDVVADRVEWSEMAYDIYTPDKRPAEPGFGDFTSSLHPDDLERVLSAVQAAFERDTPFDLDHRVVSASRGVRTVHAQGQVFRNAGGRPIRMVGTVQDITERKRIENVLRFIADPGNVENAEGFLTALARFLGEELGVRYVIIDQLADDQGIAETVALYADGGIVPNMRYALKDTPCDNVVGKRVCCYPQGVQALFPQDELLVAMEAESYAGIPLWDSTGKPVGLIAVMDDAPIGDPQALVNILQLAAPRVAAELERGHSERILKTREQEFRSLVENLPDIVVRYDRDARFVYVNPQFEAALGVSMEDLLGKTPTQAPGLPDAEFFEQQVKAAVQSGKAAQFEHHIQTADGKFIWGSIRIAPEFDEDGKLLFVQMVTRDLSERKQAEIALKEKFDRINELNEHLELSARNLEEQAVELEASQEQLKQTETWYRGIIHSAPEGMVVVNERGTIMLVNAQLEAMFGYGRGELAGTGIGALLPQDLRESHAVQCREYFSSGIGHRDAMSGKVLLGRRKDGTTFPVDVSLSRLPEIDDMGRAVCASVRDITTRRAMEAARETALAEALRLAQLRSAFMAQMSHELRTPLNGILGYAQNLLLQSETLSEKQVTGLRIIQHSGEHLLSLINGILDHAAIEADKFELIPGDIELEIFLAAIVGIIRIRAEQKNIAFACEADAGLPAVVRGDAQRLRQVLLNLLANAVKFTDCGQVTLRVSYIEPSRLHFAVQDSGVGIAAEQLEAIFEPFEQTGDIRRRAGGNGLGLAISRKLVRLMGGDIAVESQPGVGSTFSFDVEMARVQSGADKVNAAALAEQAATPVMQAMPLMFSPPREALDNLHAMALRGSMRNVIQHAEQLAGTDARYQPFVEQLRQLAKGFQTKALVNLISAYRKRQE